METAIQAGDLRLASMNNCKAQGVAFNQTYCC